MIYLLYAAACWPLISVLTAIVIFWGFHQSKVRERAGVNARFVA
jgi:hypothetical protein